MATSKHQPSSGHKHGMINLSIFSRTHLKNVIAMVILVATLFLLACGGGGPPKADFQASATDGQAALSVTFSNKSQNADAFQWDFGDSVITTSTTKDSVSHEYTKAGTYTVTLTASKTDESSSTISKIITVNPGTLAKLTLEATSITLAPGQKHEFSAQALDSYDNVIPDVIMVYHADDAAGQVDGDGVFTAGNQTGVYEQALTVQATQNAITMSAAASVTIECGPIDVVVLSPETADLGISQSQVFSAQAMDAYQNLITEAQFTWNVADGLGTITSDGTFTSGTKAGTFEEAVTVTAQLGDVSKNATASVTISPDPFDKVTVAPIEVAAGQPQQLEAIAADQYGNRLNEVTATWAILDENAGSIDQSGILTGGNVAETFVDAVEARIIQGEETHSVKATVDIIPGLLEQVIIAPDPAEIGIEMTQQFVAVGADEYGNRITGLTYTWSVENGGGTIDENGLFKAGSTPGSYQDTVKAEITQGDITYSGVASVTVEPDRIAFVSDRNDDQDDIYVMNIDGTDINRCTTSVLSEWNCSWSPDGRRIAYGTAGLTDGIRIMNEDGEWNDLYVQNDELSLTSSLISVVANLYPQWSPDGTKIVFVDMVVSLSNSEMSYESGDIYTIDIDGGNLENLTNNTSAATYWTPSWSPDGTKIVYDFTAENQRGDIYVMDANGSNPRRLTSDSTNDTYPVWSPNGTKIAFMSERDGDYEIYVMNADGSNLRQLTTNNGIQDVEPSWSPDGTKIVFTSDRDITDRETREIYIMDNDGNNVIRLTDNSFSEESVCWAPRKSGIEVSEASVIIPNASALKAMTIQDLTKQARKAVVRIETDLGSGSGFIVGSEGMVMTCNHVISDAEEITVYLENGTKYSGTVETRDLLHDLAIVKIEATGLPYLRLGDLSQISLGQQVVVLGYPLKSKTISVTSGLVSAIDYDSGSNINWIKTDSTINFGNSGGPLLDLQGRVIGMVSAKLVGSGIEGTAFAISSNTIELYMPSLALP